MAVVWTLVGLQTDIPVSEFQIPEIKMVRDIFSYKKDSIKKVSGLHFYLTQISQSSI